MRVTFFSSAFCEPCARTRAVLGRAEAVVPGLVVHERDVARHIDEAEHRHIRSTPTVTIDDPAGVEVFRAEGIPTLDQVLVAIAKAV